MDSPFVFIIIFGMKSRVMLLICLTFSINSMILIDTLQSINQTFITLIPKKSKAERIQDYRPISLLNNSYKIISKCLATRFCHILNSILDNSQSTFLLGRNISNCFLVAQETLHLMHM